MRRPLRPTEHFAAVVDGASPTDARDVAGREAALTPLLSLSQQLQALPLGPSADFRDSLRSRLMAVAAVGVAPAPTPAPLDRARAWVSGWRVQRGLAAATASMAAVVAIAGVSTAGVRSLPGDPFYSVKRTGESAQLALTHGDVGRGKRHLELAERRLDEVKQLVGNDNAALRGLTAVGSSTTAYAFGIGDSALIRDTLGDMNASTTTGARLLTEAYREDGKTGPLKALRSFVRRQKAGLAEVLPELPVAAQEVGADSLQLIADVEMRTNALLTNGVCGTDCAPPPVVSTPEMPATPAPAAQTTPGPTSDDLGPQPCSCGQAQPTPQPAPKPTQPAPSPTPSRSPSPSPSSSPSPTREPRLSDLIPTAIPEPVRDPVVGVVDTIEDALPSLPPAPLPVPAPIPVPAGDASAELASPATAQAQPRPAAGPLPVTSAQ
ncbi:MAG TPA: DUF5667 domain-containing protein [Mycobacteriales bacterium]|nr:DUF5667 domain-containing protein [Mycobacteriales bacterium]